MSIPMLYGKAPRRFVPERDMLSTRFAADAARLVLVVRGGGVFRRLFRVARIVYMVAGRDTRTLRRGLAFLGYGPGRGHWLRLCRYGERTHDVSGLIMRNLCSGLGCECA